MNKFFKKRFSKNLNVSLLPDAYKHLMADALGGSEKAHEAVHYMHVVDKIDNASCSTEDLELKLDYMDRIEELLSEINPKKFSNFGFKMPNADKVVAERDVHGHITLTSKYTSSILELDGAEKNLMYVYVQKDDDGNIIEIPVVNGYTLVGATEGGKKKGCWLYAKDAWYQQNLAAYYKKPYYLKSNDEVPAEEHLANFNKLLAEADATARSGDTLGAKALVNKANAESRLFEKVIPDRKHTSEKANKPFALAATPSCPTEVELTSDKWVVMSSNPQKYITKGRNVVRSEIEHYNLEPVDEFEFPGADGIIIVSSETAKQIFGDEPFACLQVRADKFTSMKGLAIVLDLCEPGESLDLIDVYGNKFVYTYGCNVVFTDAAKDWHLFKNC